jgi:hypothetical protein
MRPSAFVRSLAFSAAFPAGGLVAVQLRLSDRAPLGHVAVFAFRSLVGCRRFGGSAARRLGVSVRVRGCAGCWLVSVPVPGSISSRAFAASPGAGSLVFLSSFSGSGLVRLQRALAWSGLSSL